MKNIILSGLLVSAMAVNSCANAGPRHDGNTYKEYAQVIDVEPIVRVVEVSSPRRECWQEEVHHPVHRRERHASTAGGMIVGGLVGGVIGHQFGGGHGKDLATIAGTLVGASIGHDVSSRGARRPRYPHVDYEQRCRTVNDYRTEERHDGYRVTYVYHGETFTTRLPYDPGNRLPVRVKVTPVHH